ncbi:MAG: hypothetical protein AAGI52_12100 [Bacteroidota bacterium]
MVRLLGLLGLALLFTACDSGTDSLVLDGEYTGTGQFEVILGGNSSFGDATFTVTFDDQSPGFISGGVRLEETVNGAPPQTFTGTLSGELMESGDLTISGLLPGLSGGDRQVIFSGTATSDRIEVGVSGTYQLTSDLVLRR